MSGRARAYLGMSIDGRIAGPEHSLRWLHEERPREVESSPPESPGAWVSYDDFMADIGVLLMGRRTFDVVSEFDRWPYGDLPVVVASSRALPENHAATVSDACGSTSEILAAARARTEGGDVYVDGGQLVSSFLDDGLLDELTTTVLPTVRGPGVGLFESLAGPHNLDLVDLAVGEGGAVQLRWIPQGI